jgi:hypothetical protein
MRIELSYEELSFIAESKEHLQELIQEQERYLRELQEEQIIEARIRSLSLWEFIKIKLGR